jgi:HEAT repeat protein
MEIHRKPRTLLWLAAVVLFSASATACEKDPHDYSTWTPKLSEQATFAEAIRNLDRLKDTRAIKPLGEAWIKWNKPSNALRAIISIASFDDPTGTKAYIKRSPDYKEALPFLIKAVDEYDPTNQISIDDAALAASHLGRSKDPAALDVLVRQAGKSMPKSAPANRVRAATIRALGNFKDPRAVATLIKILEGDTETQDVRLHANAALALAETGDPQALPALARAAFVGPIFAQVRQGITRAGKPGVQIAMDILDGKQPDVAAFAKEKNFAKTAPGALVYKSALLLGDLRAKEAVPKLVAKLKEPTASIGFDPRTGAEYGTSHVGVLAALKLIGDPSAADAVFAYMTNEKTDDFALRPLAIDAYSMLATSLDKPAADFLLKNINDANTDPNVRNASIIAYGRLGRTADEAAPLKSKIAEYEAQAKKWEGKAKSAKNDNDKGNAEQEQLNAEAQAGALKEGLYRIEVAIQCKQAVDCYVAVLDGKDVAVGQPGLAKAERALLELRKMGPKAASAVDRLLESKNLGSSERIVREGILLALPRIAPLPCKTCATRMDEVMSSQSSQTTLDLLNTETRIIYHYFLWAGT